MNTLFAAITFALATTFTFTAQAQTCQLDKPIEFKNPLFEGVVLSEISFSTNTSTSVVHNKDLSIHFFDIQLNGNPTGLLGAQIYNQKKLVHVAGFTNTYNGNFELMGHANEQEGVTTYHTQEIAPFIDSDERYHVSYLELTVKVKDNAIVAAELKLPQINQISILTNLREITNPQQTVCIRSAKQAFGVEKKKQ